MDKKSKKEHASQRRVRTGRSIGNQRRTGSKVQRQEKKSTTCCKRHLYFLLGFVLATIWAFSLYSHSLDGPFIFDDIPNIERNLQIRLHRWTLDGAAAVFLESLQPRRPVVNFSFALNYYLHGYDVRGYRVFNVLVHVLNGLLVFLLAKTTLGTPAMKGRYRAPTQIALIAALLFLVHPVAVQSVAYVVQRMTSIATFFFLLSLLCYANARLGKRHAPLLFAGSLISALLAFGSKEFTATLPVIVLLYELYFFRDLKLPTSKRYLPWVALCLLAIGVISLLFLGGEPLERIFGEYGSRDFSLWERLLTELRVVVYYLSLFIWPHPGRLNLDYDFGVSTSLRDPVTTLLSLIFLTGLAATALLTARRYRLVSFAIWWYLINLVIESTVIPLEIIYEHRTYLPFIMLFMVLAALLIQEIEKRQWRLLVVGVLFLTWSAWTYQRAAVWGDALTLYSDVVEKSPDKARPHNNLGAVLRDAGRIQEAIPHFQRAIELDPDYKEPLRSLGDIYYRLGNPNKALVYFEQYVKLVPENPVGHANLAIALDDLNRVTEAISHYERAIALDARAVKARHYLAVLLFKQGAPAERPIQLLKEAVALEPGNSELQMHLGQILMQTGRIDEAEVALRRARLMDPTNETVKSLLKQLDGR